MPDTALTAVTQSNEEIDRLEVLLGDFARSRSMRLSAGTIRNYVKSGEMLARFLIENGLSTNVVKIRQRDVEDFLIDLRTRPGRGKNQFMDESTVAKHYKNLQQVFRWLEDQDIILASPMRKIDRPKPQEKLVPVIRDDVMEMLIKSCAGKDYLNLRDAAMLWMLRDTGLRASELLGLSENDLDTRVCKAVIRGKGNKVREVVYGPETADALFKFLRARRGQRDASVYPQLWLGRNGPLSPWGLRGMLVRRGKRLGLPHIIPHQFRHTFAHNHQLEGGQETELMRLAGWTSRTMVARYAASAGAERAQEHYRQMLAERSLKRGRR